MKVYVIALAAALVATPAVAMQDSQSAEAVSVENADSFDLARKRISQCTGERFEFVVADQPGAKGTNVGLCSKDGATKEELAAMLRSAIEQLERAEGMPLATRDQIIAQIRLKLVDVEAR